MLHEFYDRAEFPYRTIVEMAIWCIPTSSLGSRRSFKVSLFYGRQGERIVGYDNERGKGDHRHLDGREEPCDFSTVEILVADFLADIKRARGET